jgi:apolipoprotein N-acyltransferase
MSFVLVAVNAALAELWLARAAGRDDLRRALGGLGLAGAALAAVLVYGAFRLHDPGLAPDAPPVRVGVVQGNLDIGQQWREELYGRNLDAYLSLTRRLLADAAPPAVVFWPENALTFFLSNEPRYRAAIGRVLTPSGAQLVTGGPRWAEGDDLTFYSSAFLVSPQGDILAIYDKQRLLPFGEYFPLASLDFLRRRFARVREFTPGLPSPPLPTAIGTAGVTICNEAMFPEIAAARVRAGAVYLVDPANDTWLTPKFSAQQFDIVTLRAVEERRYLVRASTSGPSAIVDPFGRVVRRSTFSTQTAFTGDIRATTVVTPYCRIGDLFAFACAAIAAVAWLAAIVSPQAVAVVASQSA